MPSTITPIPLVTYRWTARLPDGRCWSGSVEMPDCDGALEQGTHALRNHLGDEYGVNVRRNNPVFSWRRDK